MTVKGVKGDKYILENEPLAKGGEGEIYNLYNDKDLLAKIYSRNFINNAEKKLLCMVKKKIPSKLIGRSTWPIDVIYDIDGKFVGFIMKKIPVFKTLLEVKTSHEYKKLLLSQKIQIAKKLCDLVIELHKVGVVIGDFNPTNVLVDVIKGDVYMLDVDSYQITDKGQTYKCAVGQAEYLAPELAKEKNNNHSMSFTKQTDNFALAVHIFQLLMNGCHPFSCRVLPSQVSEAYPQPTDNIINGVFPFMQPSVGTTIPMYAPPIDILPIDMQKLFERAFVEGYVNPLERPNAQEWVKALNNYLRNIVFCDENFNHQYYKGLKMCPHCQAMLTKGDELLDDEQKYDNDGSRNIVFLIDTSLNMEGYQNEISKIINNVLDKIIKESKYQRDSARNEFNVSIIEVNNKVSLVKDFTAALYTKRDFIFSFNDKMDLKLGLSFAIDRIHEKERSKMIYTESGTYYTPWIFLITENELEHSLEKDIKDLLIKENHHYCNWCFGELNFCVINVKNAKKTWKTISKDVYSSREFIEDIDIDKLFSQSVIEIAHSGPVFEWDEPKLIDLPDKCKVVPSDW